nr:uncharacterized protein LOC109742872 [Aegilops tauschii subsp. strangulata]
MGRQGSGLDWDSDADGVPAAARRRELSGPLRARPGLWGHGPVIAGVVIVGGVVVTICYGTFETVPYTNRRHFVVLTHNGELKLGDWHFNSEKKKLGDKVLPPSHPAFVRVSGIAPEIIRAAGRSLAVHDDNKLLDDTLLDGEIWVGDAAPSPKKKARARQGAPQQPTTKHLDGFEWEVIVVDNKQVNAMCAPGGKIIVYTGLLDKFSTDAEIATVLGHEDGDRGRSHWDPAARCRWFRSTHA